MESIRILQDVYERLYALTTPIVNLLEKEMPKISSWKDKCDSILRKHTNGKNKEWKYFTELDLYYLLVLLENVWAELEENSDSVFFTYENWRLFVSRDANSVLSIRNEIAHPENWDYDMETYLSWKKSIAKAASKFGESIDNLLENLHSQEKQRLLDIIKTKVICPALSSSKLDADTKEKIQGTLERLEIQNTAAGIIYFFEDALRARGGIKIGNELNEVGLTSFEDIADEVLDSYYGG